MLIATLKGASRAVLETRVFWIPLYVPVSPPSPFPRGPNPMPTAIAKPTDDDQDYFAWQTESAALIRDGRMDAIDKGHLAEELEDLGRSERRAVESHLRALIVHLLKRRHQRDRRGARWELSIGNARDAITRRLEKRPSLRPRLATMIVARYPNARRYATPETGLPVSGVMRPHLPALAVGHA